jgi:hypothetical protein
VRTRILAADTLPPDWRHGEWDHSCTGTAPGRMAGLANDARWSVRYATAWDDDNLLGVMPICRPAVEHMWDQDYDFRRLLARSGAALPADARRWLVLGGCRDLAGGAAVRPGLAGVREALIDAALDTGRAEGLAVVAGYVRDSEVEAFVAPARGKVATADCGEVAVLPLPAGDMPDYLGMLDGRRRNKIRRDWRDFASTGLQSSERDVLDVVDRAAPLVAAVKRRHGIADHPRIAALRLQQWYDLGMGRYTAFVVTSDDDERVAACFTCLIDDSLEVYEIGLTDHDPIRLTAYLEAAFYAPIRFALHNRCATVELGGEAALTKQLRGARMEKLWALAFDSEGAQDA